MPTFTLKWLHHTDKGMALQAQHCPTLGEREGRKALYTLRMVVILQTVGYAFVRTAAAKWLPPARRQQAETGRGERLAHNSGWLVGDRLHAGSFWPPWTAVRRVGAADP